MFHKRPLDTIRHQLPIRHVSFKSRKQYRTDTGKIGSKALAQCFPARPLGRRRPPDALGPASPGRPRGPSRRIRPRPRGLPGCGGHTRGGAASAPAAGPGPLPPGMTGSDRAECRPPHPHLTSETIGVPRAHTGHTQETPELGTPQRPPPNPQQTGGPCDPSPAEAGRQGPRTLGEGAGRGGRVWEG